MSPVRPSTILVVDGVRERRSATARTLTEAGYPVVQAASGGEALAALDNSLALIVLDAKLPDMRGFELAAAIRNAESVSIPILHLSAIGQPDHDKAGGVENEDAHADAYLTHPVAAEVLQATVHALVRRGRVEESLLNQDNVRRLTSVLANVPAAVTEWDEQFRVTYWSAQAEKMFGWSAEEVLGKTPAEFDFVFEDDIPQVERVHVEMCSGQVARTHSYNRNRHKDGSILYCEWYNSCLRNASGGRSNLGITLDVTTRVHYEQEISALNRELQRRVGDLEALLQAMPVGIAIAEDPECRRIRANATLSRMLGVPVTANVSMSAPDAERPVMRYFRDGHEVPAEELPQQVAGRTGVEVRDVELEFERADGSRGVLFGNATPLLDENGGTRGSVAAWLDITERRRAEEALREFQERFRALVIATSDVVYRMSPDWSELRQLHGREFIADTLEPSRTWLQKYVPPDDQPRVMAVIQEAVRTESIFELEHRVVTVDGSLGWTFSRAIPLRNANGEIVEWFGAASDITERKRTEEALRASEKLAATGKLAAALAHEINNPLAAVTNLLYLMDHDQGLSTVTREYLNMAAGELDRVAHITRSMLSFYRHPAAPAPMIVSRTVEGVVNLHRPQLQGAGVQVDFRVEGEYPAAGFAAEVQQIVSNLLLNAMESLPGGGRVLVEVRASRCWSKTIQPASDPSKPTPGLLGTPGTRVLIADNGPGIPREHRGHLFEPFYSTKAGKGTGLGLWVCSNLAERNGGFLRFRTSTRPERHGTCFCLFIPDAAQRRAPAAGAQAAGED